MRDEEGDGSEVCEAVGKAFMVAYYWGGGKLLRLGILPSLRDIRLARR